MRFLRYRKLKAVNSTTRRSSWQAYFFLMLAVSILFLAACQGQNEHLTEMPHWVQEWILEKPVLKFAYEEGLLYETPVVSDQDGVTLTIWGTNVTPYFTDVIFSVEGSDVGVELSGSPTHTYELTTLDGEEIRSFGTTALYSPNGMADCARIETITTESLEQQTINFALKSTGNKTGEVATSFTVNPVSFRDYYKTKALDYEKTVGEITLKTGRIHYSPAQIWVEYSISSNQDEGISYTNAYIEEIKLSTLGEEVIIEPDNNIIDESAGMRVIVFTHPRQITEDAKLIFSKGRISIGDEALSFEGSWEIPLPSSDSDGFAKPADTKQPYSSVAEAFVALKEQSSDELYFESVIYEYRSSTAYEAKKPVYLIQVREGEITDGMSNAIVYEVAEEIVDHGAAMIPISHESLNMLKQNQTALLKAYLDRTHEVVNLAKEQGRDLAEEAFLLGDFLKGYYNGDWYLVAFETSLPQAGFNVKTQELVVAKDSTGMNFVNGRPEQK